jgi:hypothetical protein
MSEDRTWRLSHSPGLSGLKAAAEEVASGYAGVSVRVEDEGEGTLTAFFNVPGDPESEHEDEQEDSTCELSVYDLDGDGHLLALEWESGDNSWLDDEADQLAEDMAEALEGRRVDL